jgi:nickel-dependent lactate racemase
MLAEIRAGNPNAKIIILISTGCHRETTYEELEYKFGPEIMRNEKIVIHDCDDEKNLVKIGYLPSGSPLIINRTVVEADLVASEGFIEPHFFAGFSGGRKSIFPGVTSRMSVLHNHNAQYINHPNSRTGILKGNPIHEEMLFAARAARLEFICNVVINGKKDIIFSVAGDCDLAHIEGVKFLQHQCRVNAIPSDIVISTNGGYPMDQNIYQAVKGMTAAEVTVKDGGVIIMVAKSNDGHGGEQFYKSFKNEKDLNKMTQEFLDTPSENTIPDQWQSQIFARILQRAKVVYVSDAPIEMVRDLHMVPAHSIEEALMIADKILAKEDSKIAMIPNGISVVVE